VDLSLELVFHDFVRCASHPIPYVKLEGLCRRQRHVTLRLVDEASLVLIAKKQFFRETHPVMTDGYPSYLITWIELAVRIQDSRTGLCLRSQRAALTSQGRLHGQARLHGYVDWGNPCEPHLNMSPDTPTFSNPEWSYR